MLALRARAPVAFSQARKAMARLPAVPFGRSRTVQTVRAFKEDEPKHEAAPPKTEVAKVEQQPQAVSPRRSMDPLAAHPIRRMSDMMDEMQREMDTLMGSFFGYPATSSRSPSSSFLSPRSMFDSFMPRLLSDELMPSAAWAADDSSKLFKSLALDVQQDDKAYYLHAEVPGFTKDDVKVTLSPDNVLTVTAQCKQEEDEKDKEGKPTRYFRSQSSYTRSVQLPDHVDTEAVTATTKDGVLSITLPKTVKPEQKPKEIPIN